MSRNRSLSAQQALVDRKTLDIGGFRRLYEEEQRRSGRGPATRNPSTEIAMAEEACSWKS
ncbi:hypothetical protein M407DRAFT_30423 [Tulasnella calospora MUT 4182]|uniref:Uncharacterized protein n=1 Tax=Tulasnella calospora MUT 4182 TaxID=1051891 RepID=A0A0C3LER7_9AGAM|nr:hypothetical protein M407DRAFT_30423 [Tulasnella calospora MUT 4182]